MHPSCAPAPSRRRWFPRARGDAPIAADAGVRPSMVPPRTRGCTLEVPLHVPELAGSPAHAGMHPSGPGRRSTARRFPRARGDAPVSLYPLYDWNLVPPRTRGCTVRGRTRAAVPRGSPAHAGMHPRRSAPRASGRGFPRARGDAPRSATGARARTRVPPRTRGCTPRHSDRREPRDGSPAHAGMHLSDSLGKRPKGWFPRARGDAPPSVFIADNVSQVPPRTRGCTPGGGRLAAAARGSPAHAGMHPTPRGPHRHHYGFPRARGDAPCSRSGRSRRNTVPPRTRGCTLSWRYKPV